jgi:hypothetical protein
MPALTTTRNYSDGTTLTEAQLDALADSIETWANSTKLDSTNLQAGGVVEATLASGSVTEAKLGTGAVTTTKITDSAVTTAKLGANAVTRAKLEAVGQQVSSSCGNAYSNSTTTYSDITNLSVSITTTGRPVHVMAIDEGTGTPGYFAASVGVATAIGFAVKCLRGATLVGESPFTLNSSTGFLVGPSAVHFFDVPAAGTYTYKLQMKEYFGGGAQASAQRIKLVAYEL